MIFLKKKKKACKYRNESMSLKAYISNLLANLKTENEMYTFPEKNNYKSKVQIAFYLLKILNL